MFGIKKQKEEAKRQAAEKTKKFNKELYYICCKNIRYIKALLPTLNMRSEYAKGPTMVDTRRKRKNIKDLIKWYEKGLEEQKSDAQRYAALTEIQSEY